MQESRFIISFPEHISASDIKNCLTQLADAGSTVRHATDGTYEILCAKQKVLEMTGWLLFNTHIAKKCLVERVSGRAENRASAYPTPDKRG